MNFTDRLEKLKQEGLLRQRKIVQSPQSSSLVFDGKSYLSFCSNDYLGLANHPELIKTVQQSVTTFGVGGGASHLVCGHASPHEEGERVLAEFVGLPSAIYFSTGYMAAIGAIPALVGKGDAIFSDALNHACLIDGIRLSKAEVHTYPHVDLVALESALQKSTSENKLIVSDAVFSMDGDIAPIPELLALCEKYDAYLYLDDAHGFGVLGEAGRGSLSHFKLQSPRIIYMGTLGKAAGVFGAFIAGSADIVEWLVQRARSYVFTTAAPPMLAESVIKSVQLIQEENWRRDRLKQLIEVLREGLQESQWQLLSSSTPIQPIIVGDNHAVMKVNESLLKEGIWVSAIRPPTVPANTARLRISLSASHTVEDVHKLANALNKLSIH